MTLRTPTAAVLDGGPGVRRWRRGAPRKPAATSHPDCNGRHDGEQRPLRRAWAVGHRVEIEPAPPGRRSAQVRGFAVAGQETGPAGTRSAGAAPASRPRGVEVRHARLDMEPGEPDDPAWWQPRCARLPLYRHDDLLGDGRAGPTPRARPRHHRASFTPAYPVPKAIAPRRSAHRTDRNHVRRVAPVVGGSRRSQPSA